MRVINFITSGFSRFGDVIGRKMQESQKKRTEKERAEFEIGLQNQLELVPKADKAQEMFTSNGLNTLTVEPVPVKDHLYITGEISVTDYRKYRDVLNKVLSEIGCEISPTVYPEVLGSGKVRIGQHIKISS